jgi:response regulator NasT
MTRLRIAVADDEVEMRDYFRRILPRLGYEVVSVAENGRELVDACRAHRPDLLITDVKMPEMDGLTAALLVFRELALPVILVSGHIDPRLSEPDGAQQNFVFLEKPINQKKLRAGIAQALAK